jgi:hypothetical protein
MYDILKICTKIFDILTLVYFNTHLYTPTVLKTLRTKGLVPFLISYESQSIIVYNEV